MKKFYIFCATICCFAIGAGAPGHHFIRAAHAKASQAEKPEFRSLLAKAEKGDSDAQFKVGLKYALGKDTPQDIEKAGKWYEKAAAKGHPVAQNNLGDMLIKGKDKKGKGLKQDVKKGLELLAKAAKQDSTATLALNNLAVYYYTGTGVSRDVDKAVEYYTRSAELGDEMAIFTLGMLYYEGVDVPQDDEKATKWFTKAAKKGDKMAEGYLERIKNNVRDDISQPD